MSRVAFLRKLAALLLPFLLPFVAQFFRRDTGESDMPGSVSGPLQGHPFDPCLFCCLRSTMSSRTDISRNHPRVKLLALLDDFVLLGATTDVALAFEKLRAGRAMVALECCNERQVHGVRTRPQAPTLRACSRTWRQAWP